MMTPAQSFETITRLLERAMEPGLEPRDVRQLVIAAHTHAVIQAASTRRAEARQLFARFPEIESRPQ